MFDKKCFTTGLVALNTGRAASWESKAFCKHGGGCGETPVLQ